MWTYKRSEDAECNDYEIIWEENQIAFLVVKTEDDAIRLTQHLNLLHVELVEI